MVVNDLGLDGVVEICPKKFPDSRGFFSEVFNHSALEKHGISVNWVQDNHSYSKEKGVIRGLHYQKVGRAQDKLVRVVRGRIRDVVVDIRHGSPNFGKWIDLELSAEAWNQIYVPRGFAHGFMTLEPDTEVIYKVSDIYSPEHNGVIRFDDPDIGIDWEYNGVEPIVSEQDAHGLGLAESQTSFVYE